MAKSFKIQYINVLESSYYKCMIGVRGKVIPVYAPFNSNVIPNVNIHEIINREKLSGNTFPKAIVQYFTITPWDGCIEPMIAFIWSWGGPWAYIYNVQYPELSKSGVVPFNRIVESAELQW